MTDHRTTSISRARRIAAGLLLGCLAAVSLAPTPASASAAVILTKARLDDRGAGLRPFSGDFDGDGSTDIFWYGPGAAPDHVEFSGPSPYNAVYGVNGNYLPFSGDFNGDKKDDVFWYAPGPAVDWIWYSQGRTRWSSVAQQVNGTFTPLVGHFTSDPTDDILWYAPGFAADSLWDFEVNQSVTKSLRTINGTYRPVVANLSETAGGVSHPGIDDIFWAGATASSASTIWFGRSDGTATTKSVWIGGGTTPTFAPLATSFVQECIGSTPPGPVHDTYCFSSPDVTKPIRPSILFTAPGKKDAVVSFANEATTLREIGQTAWGTSGGTRLPLLEGTGKAMHGLYTYVPNGADEGNYCDGPTLCGGSAWDSELGAGYIPLRWERGGAQVVMYHPTKPDVLLTIS